MHSKKRIILSETCHSGERGGQTKSLLKIKNKWIMLRSWKDINALKHWFRVLLDAFDAQTWVYISQEAQAGVGGWNVKDLIEES